MVISDLIVSIKTVLKLISTFRLAREFCFEKGHSFTEQLDKVWLSLFLLSDLIRANEFQSSLFCTDPMCPAECGVKHCYPSIIS